ncbi:PadR family transcriptional regulator [Nocardioides massiliensis]|uniref:DNA-binding PadR family transcriptional regulator n=1 Tax=Nocardioides massiliensis TaxID=1325935 RepID=A0ABT9NPR7_9ACTN|nr:PadR family transcriptional regulator [Nocardioides massiliensis]MDP9822414.1 DNA-binding PadR family transcriptional regulator [Nocardioides massiliensis]
MTGADRPKDPWAAATDALGAAFGGRGPAAGTGTPPWVRDLVRGLGGPGGPGFGSGFGQARPRRARRGDVRAAILDVLATEPMNGYQLIQQIADRTDGAWKPSPGSVYPTVQALEDEGLVAGEQVGGRRLLALTEEGRRYVAEHPDELAATWEVFTIRDDHTAPGADDGPDLGPVIGQVLGAVGQVVLSGTRQQKAEATEILAETRRRLYGLLADDES